LQRHVFPALLTISVVGSLGASCGKKSSANPDEANQVLTAIDKAETDGGNPGKQPINGVDLADLSDEQKAQFEELVDSLPSPCGQATSLRKSTTGGCPRALFAARYVALLLGEAASENEVRELYQARYVNKKVHTFDLSGSPHLGAPDAKVVIVEFFDFGCPACRASIPLLHQLIEEYDGKVVLHYKQFPIDGHAHSVTAAQGALAAHRQGKYYEMYEHLMNNPGQQTREAIFEHAESLGLDKKKFAADFEAVAPVVLAEKQEGIEIGVAATPTFFINGREYNDPISPDLLAMWIEEEIGIAR
jgi:protein-disulfide isomerase